MATLTVTPTYRSRDDKARAPAKLATTMLEVLAAGSADSARFQRGRAYARDGAVVVLHIAPGRLEAEVAGSRSHGYEVTIDTVLATGVQPDASNTPASLMPLVPEADDLRYHCTCPDWEDPCKHAIAALLAFAAEVGDRPELLRVWRVGASERAKVGAAKDKPLSVVRRSPAKPAPIVELWERPEWRQYLGIAEGSPTAPAVRELLPGLPGESPEMVGNIDAGQIVESARDVIARQIGMIRDLRRR
jgi:SWIM zinc finger